MIPTLLLLFQSIAALSTEGAAAMRDQRYADAVQIYTKAVAADRANPMWRMNLGVALSYMGRHQDAVKELGLFLKARPAPGAAHFVSGLSLLKLGRPCDAVPMLEAARKWKPSREVSIELGDAYQGCQRWEPAAVAYESAASQAPEDHRLRKQVAHCWWMARRYDKASQAFSPLARSHPDDAEILFEYGDTLARTEGAEAGAGYLRRAVAAAPELVAARGALGRALMEMDRAEEALPHLEAAAPADAALLLPLSRAYRALGRAEDAARAEAEYKDRYKTGAGPAR